MKKTRRLLAMVTAAILAIFAIAGCTNASSASTSTPTSSTQQTSTVEATPTIAEVAEPTPEVIEPTEDPVEEPTPTEAPSDSGCVIDGFDFSPYIELRSGGIENMVAEARFDEPRLIFFDSCGRKIPTFEEGDYAVLKNGETYHRRFEDHVFTAFLYTPKQVETATIEYSKGVYVFYDKQYLLEHENSILDGRLQSNDKLEYEGGTVEKTLHITYEDGTEEDFTFTITDQ